MAMKTLPRVRPAAALGLSLLAGAALAAPQRSPNFSVDWSQVSPAASRTFASYKDTPYLRDAGLFKAAAQELDRQWTAQGQAGRCDLKTTEIVTFTLAKPGDLTPLEAAVLGQLKGRRVDPIGADSPPKFFRVTGGGKTVALGFGRVFLPGRPPVLTVRACQMR
ncbi:hypothetical protein [Deinococcus murrayi]|uniref:hypothetical protein n=1 Tax=Deinococcus murrayi TaxID=68910 RepID=UPI000486B486|nr:hypothetical protein [Deinococcus murrayi]